MAKVDYSKIEHDGGVIFGGNEGSKAKMSDITIIDKDWIKTRFMVRGNDLDPIDEQNRYWSSANIKFTDSSIGGNIGVNARPQYTRYADIRSAGVRNDLSKVSVGNRSGANGMGRYYSEAIDDNVQTVYMEFGVAKFNSLFDFFTRAIDYSDSVLANTGRKPYMYKAGQFLGAGVMLAAFPLITVAIWTIKTISGLVAGHGAFDYYYLEPTMHNYWGTVNTIVTNIATELGILAPMFMNDGTKADKIGVNVQINQDDMNELKKLLPGIIMDNNYIDVYAMATRSQAMANRQALYDKELADKDPNSAFDFLGYVKDKTSVSEKNAAGTTTGDLLNTTFMFSKYLDKVVKNNKYYNEPDVGTVPKKDVSGETPSDTNTTVVLEDVGKQTDGTYNQTESDKKRTSKLNTFVEAFDSSARDGGAFAIFNVDYTTSVSESFSNSLGEIETGSTIKSLSRKSRDVKFNMAGGNILGDAVASVMSGVKDVIMGGLDSITYGGSNVIQTMMGGGYIDIPKKWEDSSVSMPQVTYKMKLISPYGNPISQLQNIYIPLAMLLAGTLPLATGRSSYTSPYLCSIFSKGVQKVKLGMITSLNITRGTSNLGFNKDRKALAIDVSFTVTDFTNIMTAPVNTSVFDQVFNVPLYDDSPLGTYISVIAARSLLDSKYTMPRIKLKVSRSIMAFEQAISPSSWGLRYGTMLSGVLGPVAAKASIFNK